MKEYSGSNYSKTYCWIVILIAISFLSNSDAFAVPIQTMDSEGVPVYVGIAVSDDPDKFIKAMKTELKQGNLDSIGLIGRELVKIRPENADVRALFSIYLISKGDIEKGKEELKRAEMFSRKNKFALYAEAMILHRKAKYEDAIKVCKKAISMDKYHPYPRNIIGRIHYDIGQYEKAYAGFKKAIELEANFLPGYTNLGAVTFIMKDYAKSISYFQRAIGLNSDAFGAHYGLAAVYEATGKNLMGIKELEICLKVKPEDLSVFQKLGELQIKAARYKDALKTGQKMEKRGFKGAYMILGNAALHMGDPRGALRHLEKAPDDSVDADYLLGYCFMANGQYDKALEYMERVLKKNKNHFGAYTARAVLKFYQNKPVDIKNDLKNRWNKFLGRLLYYFKGNVYASEGRWGKACKSWQSARDLISGFALDGLSKNTLSKGLKKEEFKYLSLGALYYFKNLHDFALSAFEEALKVNKASIFGNYWIAQVYLKKGNRIRAAQSFENATKVAPNFFAALYAAGELNAVKGKSEIAEKYYKQALKVKKDVGILIKLGLIYENSGRYEKAEIAYKKVIKSSPDLFIGYNQLAWLYARQEIKLDKAMKLAQKANKLKPGNASILDTIGWIHYQNKEFDKAAKHLGEAIKANPNNPTILFHQGKVYFASGDGDAAKDALRKALKISEKFEGAEEARKLLK